MSRFISERFFKLEPYKPGEQAGNTECIKLNTNESPYPPAPKVMEAISLQEVEKLNLYPDFSGLNLRKKIAKLYNVSYENIVIGNGSDELLSMIFMAFFDHKSTVVFPEISYDFYKVFSQLYGIKYMEMPMNGDFSISFKDYLGINKDIILANPNAPTGIYLSLENIERIISSNPENLVVIDEAYIDYGGESAYKLIDKYDNLLVVQTFSKSRSLAGARLGFAIGNRELIRDLNMIRFSMNPYNVNRLTLIAGESSIDDNEYYMKNCKEVMETRRFVTEKLRAMGFKVIDSMTNFVFAKVNTLEGKILYEELKKRGILVRRYDKELISNYLRITIGTKEQMEIFLQRIREILELKV